MAAGRLQAQIFRRFADVRKAERNVGVEALAGLGQDDLAMAALEQLGAKLFFQSSHGIGDGGLRHTELASGRGEARQPPGGLEDDQAAGGGQEMAQASHKLSLYKRSGFSSVTSPFCRVRLLPISGMELP